MMQARANRARRGITLYEVVLALSIFAAAMVVLAQSVSTGSRAAVQSRLQTQAILRCQSKLSEVIAGFEPMQAVRDQRFSDDEQDWTWSLDVADGPHPDLLLLDLTTIHRGNISVSYSLRRVVQNPQVLLDAMENQPSDEEQTTE